MPAPLAAVKSWIKVLNRHDGPAPHAFNRFSTWLQHVLNLDEAIEQAVAKRLEAERIVLETQYQTKEAALLETIRSLEARLQAGPKKA